MLSPVMLLNHKHHHITHVLKTLHWLKIPERIEYKVISLTYNKLQPSQPSYLRQLFTIQPPRSTRSSTILISLRPSVTSSLKFANRSIAKAVHPLWNNLPPALRQIYLTHPTNSPKLQLLLSLHSSLTPNLKHCSVTNPILICLLPTTSLPVSTPNTIHHSHLTVCLPDSLDLDRCLSILFWISACE